MLNGSWRQKAIVGLPAILLAGCSSIPADADGALDRAQNGTLAVGVSEHPPWTFVGPDGGVTGREADLIEGFAEKIGAEIEWHIGPESVLADAIKEGELDVVIGGLTSSAPWSDKMALTRSYAAVATKDGQTDDMVMGVPLGENALMIALERHLAHEHGEI
ncbi:substrate-binding periplasmic protein [Dietzia lutea]|uniref:ABC transporter substrate-binding protein n=1 Tax=Dietzia lutea TaxID=546160 RepID=A0A2S1RBG2_9ACTN|nr:ABC transporter substrate-binding protein [Dietzia lutea]